MEKKKLAITITTATIILLTLIAPLITVKATTDPADWYKTVQGVLDTDYYSLYPFEKKSLTIGFSKFGEFIDPHSGHGLNYSGRDPFANEGVDMKYWLNGWVLDARYVHRSYGARHLWAFAMFADMVEYGGDWINGATDPYGAPHGGRKTSGSAVTEDITVLYDGPRRFVAVLTTHLNDTVGDDSYPVLDVIFTIVFNKVKKEVIVFKDIKLTIDSKILEGPVDIQFSNRGEWDLGPSPEWKSYAHFYHQHLRTCFGADWHLSKNITREFYYHDSSFSGTSLQLPDGGAEPYGFPVVDRSEFVYVNDVWQKRGQDYEINYATGEITFYEQLTADDVKVYYKLYKIDRQTEKPIALPHEFDLAQIIASDTAVTGFAAFWPILSDYTVYGWARSLEPLYNVSEPDITPGEPEIPFVIGEWDFMLDYSSETTCWGKQFRGVTVYGVVNFHDADDVQGNDLNNDLVVENQIDMEITYQLDEVFNPWDLYQAVHKDTKRWVQFYNVTATDVANANLGEPLNITLEHSPVLKAAVWERYCSFSERVLWEGTLKYPQRSIYPTYDYELFVDDNTGEGHIWIPATKVPAEGTRIKILYSTATSYTNYGNITFMHEENNVTRTDAETLQYTSPTWGLTFFTDWLGVTHIFTIGNADFAITNSTKLTDGAKCSLTGTMDWWASDIKVFKEDIADICVYWQDDWEANATANGITVTFDRFRLYWSIAPPGEDVHIDWAHIDVDYNITVVYIAADDAYNITIWLNINGEGLENDQLYDERIPGRYEWVVVGNHSRALDSVGAALVSAAFKNKQVEIGLGGLDMPDIAWGPKLPYLLSDMGYPSWRGGPAWTNWYDSIGRLALRDDWCTTWPVSSSNVISVGGPPANLVTEYFNEFTEAMMIYGILPPLTTDYLVDSIFALSCWNKTAYHVQFSGGEQTVGYAVVSTYKDINGTVGFIIYGWTGQDTYYACKWFHEEGIFQLQDFPLCVTSLILEIDYSTHSPSVSVVECLGPISETLVHGVKGGIHPDP